MHRIETIEALEALYDTPRGAALTKVTRRLTSSYRRFIEQSRFCVISTVGPDGTDGSPRGDTSAVVTVEDESTLLLPDWRGNNRLDTLRNIVRDGRISLMFFVPGSTTVIRVNGTAIVRTDPELIKGFEREGKQPRTVIVVSISEVYSQCARALIRSGLWTAGDQTHGLPTAGQMLKEATEGAVDADAFDADWSDSTKVTLW